MLPSKGYFKSLNCPYFHSSHCDRPHCHYRHTKKEKPFDDISQLDDNQAENDSCESNENLYNILLDKNDENKILLENNEELWLSQKAKNVSYKPTPISELRKRHIPVTTAPNVILSQYVRGKLEDTQKLKAEYQPGSLHPEVPMTHLYKASPINNTTHSNIDDNELLLSNILHNVGSEEDTLSQLGDDSEEEIDFDQISSAFNFLDEFLHEYDNQPNNTKPSGTLGNKENNVICDKNGSSIRLKSDVTKFPSGEVDNCLNNHTEDSSGKIAKNILYKKNQTCSNHTRQKDSERNRKNSNEEKNENCILKSLSNKGSKYKEGKESSLNLSSQKGSDQRKVKSLEEHGLKRSSEHLSENNKTVKKYKSDSNQSNGKEYSSKKIVVEHEKNVKKDHSKSCNSSSKDESEKKHSSSSLSRRSSDQKSSSDKSSKKDCEHKTASSSNKKESYHKSRPSKGSKEKCVDSKKDPPNSHHENHSLNKKTKDDSRSKNKSGERSHSNEYKKHAESRQRKESIDKNKPPEKHRKRQPATENEEGHHKKQKQKIEAEIILDDDDEDDDDVEIINDPVSIIVIDSEEESSTKDNNPEIYIPHSPSPESFEPILPSDDSLSDSMDDENKASTTQSNILKKDDSTVPDHRVMSRIKNRVSLGYTYRPPKKKAVELMTPSARLLLFRNKQQEQELEDNTIPSEASVRVKIGSVPNVTLLLQEKTRLMMLAKERNRDTGNAKLSVQATSSKKKPVQDSCESNYNKDAPPEVGNMTHPTLRGANKETRQQHIEMMYKAARQLVKPHQQYIVAQKKCLEVEDEVWQRTTHLTYSQEMKKEVEKMWGQVSKFTLRYFMVLKARREAIFLPLQTTSNIHTPNLKGNKAQGERIEVSYYSALTKYILTPEQLEEEGYPRRHETEKDLVYCNEENKRKYATSIPQIPKEGEFVCVKCNRPYIVDEQGLSIDPKGCSYHLKKSVTSVGSWKNGHRTKVYRCCDRDIDNPCMNSQYHACELKNPQRLEGFIETGEPDYTQKLEEDWGVFAVDCEMYWSTKGSELGRVTVVDLDERIVYDTCVRPDHPVADYYTRLSGLTEKSLQEAKVTLSDVQQHLLQIINNKTILIGHSLENDLKALKLIHNTVVDTAMVFRHSDKKLALKTLAEQHLKEVIQSEEDCHNSAEDAITCIKLMKVKVNKECHQTKPKAPVMRMRYPNPKNQLCQK